MEVDREPILTCHREDAYNQVNKRSKTDTKLIVNNNRQNCVKSEHKRANSRANNNALNTNHNRKVNCSLNQNDSKVKAMSNDVNRRQQQVRRSPRSPVIAVNRLPKSKSIANNSNNNNHMNSSNHIKRSNTRVVTQPIENGNQTIGANPASNAVRRSR
jgi:hypothetical protein